jgi:nucleoside-diphosphate-sugar epimerase
LGRTASGDQVDEEKTWVESSLNTHYAISKKKAEMEVWRGIGEGLDAVIANPSTILGYGNWHEGSCAIFRRIYKEFTWYTEGVNGFVDVEDTARAVVQLMKSNITEQRFIINGENWQFKKLFETIARGFNKKPPSRHAGPFLSGLAWRMEHARSYFSPHKPLLTRETSKIALSRTYFQNAKLLKALPDFSFTPLQESITKACKKYESALKNMQLTV